MEPNKIKKKRKSVFEEHDTAITITGTTDGARKLKSKKADSAELPVPRKPKKKLAKIVDRQTALADSDDEKPPNKASKAETARAKLEALFEAQFGDPFADLELESNGEPTNDAGEPRKETKREKKRRKQLKEAAEAAAVASRRPVLLKEEEEQLLLDDDLLADIEAGGWDSDGFDIGVGSDDSEKGSSDADDEEGISLDLDLEQVKAKVKPKVEVVEFKETGTRGSGNVGSDIKSFMSSKVSKLVAAAPRNKPLTTAEKQQEAQDDANDRELAQLLRSPAFVEELTAAELQGAERRKYFESKTVKLGAAPLKQKVPSIILTGMRKAAKSRAQKQIQELKETGMFTKSAQRKIESSLEPRKKKKFRPPPNELGTVGRIDKNTGMLMVSKRTIERVEREGARDVRMRKKRTDAFAESGPKRKGGGGGGKKKGGKKKRH